MLMAVEGPYALMVQPDDILISPREVDEHFGTMACFHPRYALGDSHDYMDKDDFLREMYGDRGQANRVRGMYLPPGPQGGRTKRVPDARLDLSAERLKCSG